MGEWINVPKERLQNGDSLICRSDKKLGKTIQRFTKSEASHAAKVIKISDVLMIIDSQRKGTFPITYENWMAEHNYKYRVFRWDETDAIWGAEIRERALSKASITGYDFMSLLVWHPLYLLTGYWHGRPEAKAAKRMVCSEYVAWVDRIKDWFKMSPGKLLTYYENHVRWNEIKA